MVSKVVVTHDMPEVGCKPLVFVSRRVVANQRDNALRLHLRIARTVRQSDGDQAYQHGEAKGVREVSERHFIVQREVLLED